MLTRPFQGHLWARAAETWWSFNPLRMLFGIRATVATRAEVRSFGILSNMLKIDLQVGFANEFQRLTCHRARLALKLVSPGMLLVLQESSRSHFSVFSAEMGLLSPGHWWMFHRELW